MGATLCIAGDTGSTASAVETCISEPISDPTDQFVPVFFEYEGVVSLLYVAFFQSLVVSLRREHIQ